jgi:alpha-1,3/alpha-1,6-mannosyltransferase|tara:strand:+ start:264 stop:446 length:183 start_codon:yes stop_codon:yes gene_type:complete
MFLSINRFERKKNLNLALRAYALFRKNTAASGSSKSRLVIAGGYDERLKENVVYLSELKR